MFVSCSGLGLRCVVCGRCCAVAVARTVCCTVGCALGRAVGVVAVRFGQFKNAVTVGEHVAC